MEYLSENKDTGAGARGARGRVHKVAVIREVCGRVQARGESVLHTSKELGVPRRTIRRWLDDPRYLEATLEYDETFNYDPDDLLDRATVAQHLCRQVRCDGRHKANGIRERHELLMAVVGLALEEEPTEHRWSSPGALKRRNRKGGPSDAD